MAAMERGIKQSDARRAELIASGMTPEEAQAVLFREVVLNADPVMLAYAEGVARRSFPALYEDDEGGSEAPADDWPPGCRCVLSGGRRMSLGGPCPAHGDMSVAADDQ